MLSECIQSIWNKVGVWNDRVEKCNEGILYYGSCVLPKSIKGRLERHPVQTKLAVHTLGVSLLIQATFGNPFLSPAVYIPLGSTCILLTAGASYRLILSHLKELSALPLSKKVSCLAWPVLFGTAQGVGMWLGDVPSKVSQEAYFAINLWTANLTVITMLPVHIWLLNQYRSHFPGSPSHKKTNGDDPQPTSSFEKQELHPLVVEAYVKCQQLEEENRELKGRLKKIDGFIAGKRG